MIFTTLVSLNKFNFARELLFDEDLKLMKHIEDIIFEDKRIKPDKFRMRIHKNKKITKTIRR
jgi:hypothetical protein